MAFDRKRAEGALVDVLEGLVGDRIAGMGFRLLDGVIATACHCLPRLQGKVVLPDPDAPGAPPVTVRLRHPATGEVALAALVAADPCSDFALLRALPESVPVPPGAGASFAGIVAGLERLPLARSPLAEQRVSFCTHERRWVEGLARGASITVWDDASRIRRGTSGAPVFDQDGRVVGLVGSNDVRLPSATMCLLAERLPAWALREAAELSERGA
ncbi:S1 family peptidase [Anaeromyxobacter paludicola]|nr:serine protease [Anaeromyxobacter paludicola]